MHRCGTVSAQTCTVFLHVQTLPTRPGSPCELVKQLSVIYPCGKGHVSEADSVAAGRVILGRFTLSDGRFSFTTLRGEPTSDTHAGSNVGRKNGGHWGICTAMSPVQSLV